MLPVRGSAEWSAKREVELLLGLAGGNRRRAQWLWLQKERIKAEASQFASAGAPPASQQPAGCRAEPATARARGVPKRRSDAQLWCCCSAGQCWCGEVQIELCVETV